MNNIDERTGKPKIILHLCARMGSDSHPYADVGYDRRIIGEEVGVQNYMPPENVYGIIANPVCTNFSTADGFNLIKNLEQGMFLVKHCQRIINTARTNSYELKFWYIENPYNGRLKEILGEPYFVYQPWQFGSPWTKKTALWGNFCKPELIFSKWGDCPKINELYIKHGRKKPSLADLHKNHKKYIPEFYIFDVENDMEFRSLCSQKFAQAFFEANR